jgi:hypothetical protein
MTRHIILGVTRLHLVGFLTICSLLRCQTKTTEQIIADSIATNVSAEAVPDEETVGTFRIFPLDSILEISYSTYETFDKKIERGGVNIIDRQKNIWLFDSEGPQIEANSDLQKVSDSNFVVWIYYDLPKSKDSAKEELRIAKFNLDIDPTTKTYTFLRDTLFWPAPAPFQSEDVQKTIEEYQQLMTAEFLPDSTSNDQPHISKMFGVQERLLSAYISGCDSCSVYSQRLFRKYDPALFASDSEYAGEIISVFKILKKR